MTGFEYRQDDTTVGYCPRCGATLAAVTVGARGYCETHGWVYADWNRPNLIPGVMTGKENAQ